MKHHRKPERVINGADIAASQCFLPIFLLFGLGENGYAVPRMRYNAANPYTPVRPYGAIEHGYPVRVARQRRAPYSY